MKRIFTLCIVLCTALAGFAQTDTTGTQNPSEKKADTIKVGGMIIVRKPGGGSQIYRRKKGDDDVSMPRRKYSKPSNVSTNWWIIDLGFSNYTDNTNYASAEAQSFAPGS